MEMKECLYRTFNSSYGRASLVWLLKECGYFSPDPTQIDPALIAFANRLLSEAGLGIEGDAGRYVNALMQSYDGKLTT